MSSVVKEWQIVLVKLECNSINIIYITYYSLLFFYLSIYILPVMSVFTT